MHLSLVFSARISRSLQKNCFSINAPAILANRRIIPFAAEWPSHQNDLLNREYLPKSESKTKRGIFAEGSIQALTFSVGTVSETKLSITGLNQ